MKQIIKSLALAVLVAFGVTFFASIYMLSIVSIFKVDLNNVLVSVISMILSNITTIALYCMIKRKNFTVLIKEIKLHKSNNLKYIITSILLVLVIFIFNILLAAILNPSSKHTTTQELMGYSGVFAVLVNFIYPMILAPLTEELIFRGLLGNVFQVFNTDTNKKRKIYFVVVSSLIFSLMHLQETGDLATSFLAAFIPCISGIIFGLEYLKTKNLIYPIITHVSYNSLIILLPVLLHK